MGNSICSTAGTVTLCGLDSCRDGLVALYFAHAKNIDFFSSVPRAIDEASSRIASRMSAGHCEVPEQSLVSFKYQRPIAMTRSRNFSASELH